MTFLLEDGVISPDLSLERLEHSSVFQALVSLLSASVIDQGVVQRTTNVIALDCETTSQTVLAYAKRKASIQKGN